MPTQQGVRLDDEEGLLPELGAADQEDQSNGVAVGESGSFHTRLSSTISCCRDITFSATRSARLRVMSDRAPVKRVAVTGFVRCLRFFWGPVAKTSTGTDGACHHAMIDSRWMVDCTACYLI